MKQQHIFSSGEDEHVYNLHEEERGEAGGGERGGVERL